MSVQSGIWNFDLRPLDQNLLINISRGIAEYGPDGEGTYFDTSLGMLYRAFHTTPESRLEHQPLVTATGEVMTWDGRLDNRDELLAELRDKVADDKTDISLVAAALGQWGEDGFAKLIGDWAVVIWNPRSRKLILARDYVGVRHLFYYRRPASVLWCTDLKTLASCGDHFNLCDEYFAGFLALWPDAHLTPYTEIRAVPPGHFVRISDASVSVQAYWEFNPGVATRYKTDREYEEHFRQLFRHAVQQRLRWSRLVVHSLHGRRHCCQRKHRHAFCGYVHCLDPG
jgi:asparagine synthase (glutamine-hydrolysing)